MFLIFSIEVLDSYHKVSQSLDFCSLLFKIYFFLKETERHNSDLLRLSEIKALRLSQCICLGEDYIRQWTSGAQELLVCGEWRARGRGSHHIAGIP